MARPATGTTPDAGGYTTVDNRFQGGHRTGLIAVLFRDARGAATDISPHNPDGSVRWSPLALDGQLRADLFAQKRVDGKWVNNTAPNEGFHLVGAFGEGNGPSTKPKIDTDDQMIEQTNWPFESDITKQDEPFTFGALQNLFPAILRLRNNLPLADANGNSLVELPGGADAGWSQPLETNKIPRQFLLYGIRKRGSLYTYEVESYDFATLTDVGERQMGKKGKVADLTFKPEPSGYFMGMVDGNYIDIIRHTFVGGTAWAETGKGPVPKYSVGVGAASAGTFTLSYGGNTTAPIPYNANAAAVKSALVALDDGYAAADWTVAGAAPTITVTVPDPNKVLSGDGTGLTGGTLAITPAP